MKKIIFGLGVLFVFACSKTESSKSNQVVVNPSTPTSPVVPAIPPDTILAAKINQSPVFQFQGFNYGLWGKDWASTKYPNSKLFDYIQDCGSNTIFLIGPLILMMMEH